jgi:membrane AbrB-like protein
MTDVPTRPMPLASRILPSRAQVWPEVLTLAVATAGGLLFMALSIPGGAISGSMLAVAVLAAMKLAAPVSLGTRIVAMAVSGLSVGSAASPETIRNIITYPASILLMSLAVYATTAASAAISIKVSGWSRPTSLFAAVPGAMSYVLSLAMTPGLKVDVPQVVVVQMGRLLFLVAVVPLLIVQSGGHLAPLAFTKTDPYWMVALLVPVTAAAGWIFHRFKVAGGVMFGALLASGIVHATGLAPGRVPAPVMIAGQILIGAWAGSRFVGFDWMLLFRSLKGALGAIAAAMLVAVVFASAGAWLLGEPFAATLLAYAPGGLEAMTVLAFGLNVDPLFVAAHHFARVIVINISMPIVMRHWMRRADPH